MHEIMSSKQIATLRDPFVTVETQEPKLIDAIWISQNPNTGLEEAAKQLKCVEQKVITILDPLNNKTLCRISNPKAAIKGYDFQPQLFNLEKNIVEGRKIDFGFDDCEIATFKEKE